MIVNDAKMIARGNGNESESGSATESAIETETENETDIQTGMVIGAATVIGTETGIGTMDGMTTRGRDTMTMMATTIHVLKEGTKRPSQLPSTVCWWVSSIA